MEDSYYMIWLATILMDVFCMVQLVTRLLFTVNLSYIEFLETISFIFIYP